MALGIGGRKNGNRIAAGRRALARACPIEPLEPRQMLTLLIDLKLPDGGKVLNSPQAGQQFTLQVWATVSGANANALDDGLDIVQGSFISQNVGAGAASAWMLASPLAPFTATGASGGTQVDLDGDGDGDVGSNDHSKPDGFFLARYQFQASGPWALFGQTPVQVGTLTVHLDQVLSGRETVITFAQRQGAEGGLWVEDGNTATPKNGATGQIVVSPFRIVRPDLTAPTATLSPPAPVIDGGLIYDFTVTFHDDLAINRATLGHGDTVVIGPDGQQYPTTFVQADKTDNASEITVLYRILAPGGVWDGTKNGVYTIATVANQVSDEAGRLVAPVTLGSFTVNLPKPPGAPFVAMAPAPAPVGGAQTFDFVVAYSDEQAISRATLGDGDVIVTLPDGRMINARLVSADQSADFWYISATYRINVPNGMWDATKNGVCTVSVATGQVTDVTGLAVPAGPIGAFVVNVPPAVLTPKGLLRVIGTGGRDKIYLNVKAKTLRVAINGATFPFNVAAVKRVQVYAMGGNDFVWVGAGMIGTEIDGGAGRDTLWGGPGNDVLYSRDGRLDVLDGGAGKNTAKIDKGLDRSKNIAVFAR